MQPYEALAAEHIQSAGLTRREVRHATAAHAAVFGVIEQKGFGVFDLTREQITDLAAPLITPAGLLGWFLGGLIRAAIWKLVPIVFHWLREQLSVWIEKNTAPRAMTTDLAPYFRDARAARDTAKASYRYEVPLAGFLALAILLSPGCAGRARPQPQDTARRISQATTTYRHRLSAAAEANAQAIERKQITGSAQAARQFSSAAESARAEFSRAVEEAIEAAAPAAGELSARAWRDAAKGFSR